MGNMKCRVYGAADFAGSIVDLTYRIWKDTICLTADGNKLKINLYILGPLSRSSLKGILRCLLIKIKLLFQYCQVPEMAYSLIAVTQTLELLTSPLYPI